MKLIDTGVAAYILKVSVRRVQQFVAQGVLTNHGKAKRIVLDLAEVSAHAARRHSRD